MSGKQPKAPETKPTAPSEKSRALKELIKRAADGLKNAKPVDAKEADDPFINKR
jgi:hypothetical protein